MHDLLDPVEEPDELAVVLLAEPLTGPGSRLYHPIPGRGQQVQTPRCRLHRRGVVSNTVTTADPKVGALVGELAPRSPLYYYLPWAPLGVVLVTVLAVRLPGLGAPAWATRGVRGALGALVVAVVAKVALVRTLHRPERGSSTGRW